MHKSSLMGLWTGLIDTWLCECRIEISSKSTDVNVSYKDYRDIDRCELPAIWSPLMCGGDYYPRAELGERVIWGWPRWEEQTPAIFFSLKKRIECTYWNLPTLYLR